MSVTDVSQTTDGRATAISEREHSLIKWTPLYYTIVIDLDNSSRRIMEADNYSVINWRFSASVQRSC